MCIVVDVVVVVDCRVVVSCVIAVADSGVTVVVVYD